MAKRGPSVTKAQIARALSVARDAWGDDARVPIHPDKTITIDRGAAREPLAPEAARVRDFSL